MDNTEADRIVRKAAQQFKRTKEEKFSNPFLEDIFQSIIPVNKLLK